MSGQTAAGGTPRELLRDEALLRAIESSADAGGLTLWSLGGAGWAICGEGTALYVDPFFRGRALSPGWTCLLPRLFDPEAIRRADAVLFTHEHGDHCDETVVQPVARNTAALFAGPGPCIERARSWGVPSARLHTLGWDERVRVGSAVVHALESHDPNAERPNLYVIELAGRRILHAGDSMLFPGLAAIGRRWRPEIGMLSVGVNLPGRRYYLTLDEMVTACRLLELAHVLPMHWNAWEETALDPDRIADAVRSSRLNAHLVILHPGESCRFPRAA